MYDERIDERIAETNIYIDKIFNAWKKDKEITPPNKYVDNLLYMAFVEGLHRGNEFMIVKTDE